MFIWIVSVVTICLLTLFASVCVLSWLYPLYSMCCYIFSPNVLFVDWLKHVALSSWSSYPHHPWYHEKNIIPPRSYGKTCYEAQLISPKKKNNKHMRKSDDLHMTHIIFPKMLLIMISSTYISDIVMHFLCINHQHQELNLPNDMYIITCI